MQRETARDVDTETEGQVQREPQREEGGRERGRGGRKRVLSFSGRFLTVKGDRGAGEREGSKKGNEE